MNLTRKVQLAGKTPIKLGHWSVRNLAQPIRYLLEYTEHPYVETLYKQKKEDKFSPKEWTSVKDSLDLPFCSLPYLIDEQEKLTNQYAIMVYIANTYAPELLG